MGVNVVKLEDVCEFYRGLTYSKKDEATFSDNIVLRASNIDLDTSTLILDDLKYLKEDFVIPNDKKLQKDCIFICMSSGSKSHLGKVAYIDRDYNYAFGGFMGLIKPKTNILPRYLFYLLQTPEYKELIKKLSNGININNIKFSDLKEFQFELPSLEEQEKILNILDKADELRAKKKLANDKLDEFLKSTFISKFGDPVTNNKNLPKQKLEMFLDNVRYGTSTPPNFSDSGYSFIRATNIKKGRIVDEGMYFITEEEATKISKCKLKENEIIIVRSGVNTGDTCIITRKYAGHYAGYDIILTINDDELNPTYLNELLNTNYMTAVIKPLTRRAAQPHLNADQIKNLEIILPPIEDQNKFAQIVEYVEAQKQKNELVIEQMNNLFNSLSQRAFKGEI